MAALDDLDAGTGGKRRANPVVLDRVARERAHDVELGERASGGHQSRHVAGERGDEAVIELLLKRGGALLRGECLILVVLELGRDEALGVLERLSAVVFDGDGRGLPLGDLDVEAVDAVVLDAKAREPRLFALALFKVEEELARVVAHLAQESQLLVEIGADDVALAQKRGGVGKERGLEIREDFGGQGKRLRRHAEPGLLAGGDSGIELAHERKRVAKRRQFLRTHRSKCDAACDALDVG